MPIRLAFMDETSLSGMQLIFDLSADVCFVLDIAFSFMAVEEDANGELIRDRGEIATRYMKSWFCVDLISSLPVAWITFYLQSTPNSIQSLRFLKLAKMARLYRILTVFKLFRVIKN